MKEKIALFDLDGTLADYAGELAKEFNKIKHPSEQDYTRDDFGKHDGNWEYVEKRRHFITERGEFWENLQKLEDGFKIFDLCGKIGFRPMVLTQGPATKPEAWSHKLIWCQKHLPNVDVTITRDKGLVYGRVLVDDWPEYALRWLEHRPRGLVVMPARSWNKDAYHPNILRVSLPDDYLKLDEALWKAFNR